MISLFNYNILSKLKNAFYFFYSFFSNDYYKTNMNACNFISNESLNSNKTISYVDLDELNNIENDWEDIGADTGYGWSRNI